MNYRQLSVKEVWAFSILVLRIAVRAIARTNGYRVLRMPTAIRS
ncbi:hypothetical protein [Brasilonema sennae]|nr:hypothetical protein [Brasilonema sennae]